MKSFFCSFARYATFFLAVKIFVIGTFFIPSGSMAGTLETGDVIFGDMSAYGVRMPVTGKRLFGNGTPGHGDIVIFRYPKDRSALFVKRVIGVPGDVVETKGKRLFRNGVEVAEPYVRHSDPGFVAERDDFGPVRVPDGHWFVLGDNRDDSWDSRYWGYISEDDLVARGVARFLRRGRPCLSFLQ